MGFLSYGSGKALSYTHDFQKDIDRLYQRESYRAQVQAEKERKTLFYASLTKEATAVAPYNTRRLEELYGGLHKELAEYAIDNPDYDTDITKMSKYQGIADKFLNNNIVAEDQQVQQQWNATKEAYNNGNIFQDEYDELAEKYLSYYENGGDPYVFANPKRKELFEIIAEADKYLEPDTTDILDPRTKRWERITETKDSKYPIAANLLLQSRENRRVFEQKYNALDDKVKDEWFPSLEKYTESILRMGKPIDVLNQGYDELYAYAAKEGMKSTENLNIPSFFKSQVADVLSAGREVSGNPAVISLTVFGDEKVTLPMNSYGSMFKVRDAETGDMKEINIRGKITSKNSGKVFTVGDVAFAEVIVSVGLNPKQIALNERGEELTTPRTITVQEETFFRRQREETINEITEMSKILLDNGFIIEKVDEGSMFAMIDKEGKVISNTYSGTIIVPVTFSESNIMNYDRKAGLTDTKLVEATQAGNYEPRKLLLESLASKNDVVTNSLINDVVGGSIKIAKALMAKDPTKTSPENKKIANLNLKDISWTQDEETFGMLEGTDGISEFGYDVVDGRWYFK